MIPLELLRQAVTDNRLVFHIEPIVTLPQRRPFGYDLVPRLVMEDGGFADRPDFMPRLGRTRTPGSPLRCRIALCR